VPDDVADTADEEEPLPDVPPVLDDGSRDEEDGTLLDDSRPEANPVEDDDGVPDRAELDAGGPE
jgi:hypothetical protein